MVGDGMEGGMVAPRWVVRVVIPCNGGKVGRLPIWELHRGGAD